MVQSPHATLIFQIDVRWDVPLLDELSRLDKTIPLGDGSATL
jgi:hypothetical protein